MAVLTTAATAATRVPENIPGLFGVTGACIDCDLCRQTAPRFFKRHFVGNAGYSYVHRQPKTESEQALCMDALRGCPVEAIVCDTQLDGH
jgi:ferredoxin